MRTLERGDLLPSIVSPPPGPRARELSRRLAELEAPGINTLAGGEPNILWREALGANVQDVDGNLYLDLTSGFGVAAVGHRHGEVLAAIDKQSRRLVHGLGDAAAHEPRVELARRLVALSPIPESRVYFAVSGADAVEVALKTALLHTGKVGILTFDPTYHGLTLGALSATSRPEFREPFHRHLHPHVHRLPFGAAAGRIRSLLDREQSIGCLLLEPVVGREGVLLPPAGWLGSAAEACRERRVLLIVDEIFTGFGRTGRRFAVEREGVEPDLLCFGKALGGGMPIGGVLGRSEVLASWSAPGEARHTGTFVAHPLACAAALAVLEILERDDLAARARTLGQELGTRLGTWPQRFRALREVRGEGLLWGLELTSRAEAGLLVQKARERGVLLLAGGPEGRVAQILPPLVIHRSQLAAASDILEACLAEISERGR